MNWLKGNPVSPNIPYYFYLPLNAPVFGPGFAGRTNDIYPDWVSIKSGTPYMQLGSFHIPEGRDSCYYFPILDISLWEIKAALPIEQPESFSYRMHLFRSMYQGICNELA